MREIINFIEKRLDTALAWREAKEALKRVQTAQRLDRSLMPAPPEIVTRDRLEELKTLTTMLIENPVVLLEGDRRSGKSSLLLTVNANPGLLGISDKAIFIDCQDPRVPKGRIEFENYITTVVSCPETRLVLVDETALIAKYINQEAVYSMISLITEAGKQAILSITQAGAKEMNLDLPILDLKSIPVRNWPPAVPPDKDPLLW